MWRHHGERGGIAVYTDAIVRELLARDDGTEYLLFVRPGVRPAYESPNLRIREVAARTRLSWDQLAIPSVAEQERVDVVFSSKMSVPLRGRFAAAFALHGMEQFVHADSYPVLNRWYNRSVMGLYCRRAGAVFCPSERVKADIAERLHVPRQKIHITPYGVADRFWAPVTPEDLERVRVRYNLPDEFLLFVGGLTPLKNLPTMLKAMALLRNRIPHQLVLTGFSRWKTESGLNLVRTLGLEDRVVNAGWVEDADQPALYRLASALLFPSLYEGFGFPVAEAMASGCPVVTSTGGSLPEVAADAALVVEPLDAQALADAAERAVCDRRCAEQLIERGYRRARAFRWDRVAASLSAVFAELAAARADRRS
jgi:glycosyltransferase involved in cell wall biosynthesis